ncbi:hypothetical protein [Campylobacter suis]|uniref:YcxB-like protein domain-containing protein n=1 Tax=Campylobacter suis TaxID=2790657 RepID=A0ABM8Q347_9BACT|nr:hypothetical protein [Campylobacter suis]CAD7287251.1 hypothetical protein LMG8286_00889 [Campylobacter suis]
MGLDYYIDENDYLRYHTYILQTNNSFKKSMFFTFATILASYAFLVWFFYINFGFSLGFYVCLAFILTLLIYFIKTYKKRYEKKLQKYIKKAYDTSVKFSLKLNDDEIVAKLNNEFKLKTDLVTKLVQIPQNFFILFRDLNSKQELGIILKNDEISAKFIQLIAQKTGLSIKKEI